MSVVVATVSLIGHPTECEVNMKSDDHPPCFPILFTTAAISDSDVDLGRLVEDSNTLNWAGFAFF